MEDLGTLGYCPTCNEMMITENGVPKCFNCAPSQRPKHVVKPPPAIDVPSEAEFKKYTKGTATVTNASPIRPLSGNTAHDALHIMRNLPMPKDMKEFKQITRIIKQLEKLVGENNDD